jgi:hypothetical protein
MTVYIRVAMHVSGAEFVVGAYTDREVAYKPIDGKAAHLIGIKRIEVLELEVANAAGL